MSAAAESRARWAAIAARAADREGDEPPEDAADGEGPRVACASCAALAARVRELEGRLARRTAPRPVVGSTLPPLSESERATVIAAAGLALGWSDEETARRSRMPRALLPRVHGLIARALAVRDPAARQRADGDLIG